MRPKNSRGLIVYILIAMIIAAGVNRLGPWWVWSNMGVKPDAIANYNDPITNLVFSVSPLLWETRVAGLLAGPLANFAVAFACGLILRFGWTPYWLVLKESTQLVWKFLTARSEAKQELRTLVLESWQPTGFKGLISTIWLFNLVVGILELLPIPPFDGWHLFTRPMLELFLHQDIIFLIQLYGGLIVWVAIFWQVVPVVADLAERSLGKNK